VATLLIVEDNQVEREGMAAVLRLNGFDVLAATNADEGLKLAEERSPDLILLDMLMGASDGWHFLDMRKGKVQVPVVIVTGLSIASAEWARSLGADGLLRKPIDVDLMVKQIQERL
jgi:CheY-like chemotaxis protein